MATDFESFSLDTLRQRRSAKWRTYPADVLPLTVAEMDFPIAPEITAALTDALAIGDVGYAAESSELGIAIQGFAARRWGWNLDAAAVTPVVDVGVGAVELLRILAGDGKTVLISPPVYPPFFEWGVEAGAVVDEVPLTRGPDGWRLDLPALEKAFAEHPAVYLLCNPHNPVGRVHSRAELEELVVLAKRFGVTIVSDEIHAPLVLSGSTFTPLLTVDGAADVTVALHSASKAWNLAGLKCAAIVTGSDAMAAVVSQLPSDTRWRVGHFGVLAAVAAYTAAESWLDDLLETLDARRSLVSTLLDARLPSISWVAPEATYLGWLDCSALGEGDAPQHTFLERGAVALEPGTRFGEGGSGFVRFNFGTTAAVVEEAVTRMARAVEA